eukprot:CAMPEP_0118913934 /NCGR_PEP_ID=MMETSP1166-20130328/14512_1 /TAXON_ID=1104430 /ORGANISM="Chrysoreinhardia sp, Strain CCMP3193" /LENGTH=220 /DNA_ID=CAMNT_0006853499 /DNA_START=73 /DNA_END=735 /DNA_ORIENTATION=-
MAASFSSKGLMSHRMRKMARELEKSCQPRDPFTLFPWARSRSKEKRHKEVIRRWNIVKGDKVQVVYGHYEGQRGTVQTILKDKNLVIVDGVNVRKRRVDDPANPHGDKIWKDLPSVVHYSKINLICPITDLPTRVRHGYVDGKRTRFAARSGAEIPKPVVKKDNSAHLIGDYDTEEDDVLQVTYDANQDRDFWAKGYQKKNRVFFEDADCTKPIPFPRAA